MLILFLNLIQASIVLYDDKANDNSQYESHNSENGQIDPNLRTVITVIVPFYFVKHITY